jgi:hypothetical protein
MAWLDASNMETMRRTTQNRVKGQAHRVLSKSEKRMTKKREKKERTNWRGAWVVNRRADAMHNRRLKSSFRPEIPAIIVG